ncbi:MAG: hypothetical protein IT340_08215 [Chloroflexi bacterium]|nr:hypothetical protein [Chloroflexota bacterium]
MACFLLRQDGGADRLLAPAAIVLDWEHTEAHQVTPAEVAALDTAPRLAEALAAIYPPLEPVAAAGGSTQRP